MESLKTFLDPADEICILDTGSEPDALKEYEELAKSGPAPCEINLHTESHTVDFSEHVKRWLPEYVETFEKSSLARGCMYSFAAARQRCAELAKHPIQFWIDTDDRLVEEKPGQLRWMVNKLFGADGLNGKRADNLFLEYRYAFDKSDGSCITTLKRERIIDIRRYYWIGRCHETAIPRDNKWDEIEGAAFFNDLKSFIVHRKEFADSRSTDVRNYLILRNEMEEDIDAGRKPDPRTTFYLGNACRGLELFTEALEHYEKLYQESGSLDDRYLAMYYSGMIWLHDLVRRPLDALDCFFRCLRLRPGDGRAHFAISRCYYALGRYGDAIQYFEHGRKVPPLKINLHADDPQHTFLLPYQVAAMSARELNRPDYAKACAEAMLEKYPNHKLTKAVVATIRNDEAKRQLVDGVMRLVANEVGPDRKPGPEEIKDRVRYHLKNLKGFPEVLEREGIAALEPERDIDPEKEVIFYCGQAIEEFGPKSTGLGGSEKMVAAMAPQLQKLGFQVSVYCNCPADQRGVDDSGVLWWHWGGMNIKKERGTVIFWRMPELLELPLSCRKRIVWCHDVQDPKRWSDVRVALADQVWVLSEYHATTLGKWREALGDKVVITRNGLDDELYERVEAERDPKKIIFASSPDRGLDTAIRAFNLARWREPKLMEGARLHVFYGFNKVFMKANVNMEYRHIPDLGKDANGWEYMQRIHHAVDENDAIEWRGRVSWEDMAKEQKSAGVWLYPTRFPEISCMAAQEAQAAGCHIVASNYAALAETINWGARGRYKVDPDDISGVASAIIRAVKEQDTDRDTEAALARQRFSFSGLAREWSTLIRHGRGPRLFKK